MAFVPQACDLFHIAVQEAFQSLGDAPVFTLIVYAAFDTVVTAAISELIVYTFFGYGAPGLPEVTRHAIMASVRDTSTTTGQAGGLHCSAGAT